MEGKVKESKGNVSKNSKNSKVSREAFSVDSKDRTIFTYSPFRENDILHIGYTTFNLIVLLRNGTCITWGLNRTTLGRRCADSDAESFIPHPIKLQVRVVDIACGRNHCLARGSNFKVYSWGTNSFGQLGLSGFPMNVNSEKDEPCEIQTFQSIKIKQIFAAGNSSFALTEGANNTYGWGDNKNGQLGVSYVRSEKVQTPKLIEFAEKCSSEMVISQTKDGMKTFIAELYRPSSNISQAMIFFNNKQLHHKEVELKAEKEKLEIQEEQLKRRRGKEDTDRLIKEIEDLMRQYTDKSNLVNKRAVEKKLVKNQELIKSYQRQVDYQVSRENLTAQEFKHLEQQSNKFELERLQSQIKNVKSYNEKKGEINKKKDNNISFAKLIEDVNSDLLRNKNTTLAEHMHSIDKFNKVKEKIVKYDEYIDVFQKVKVEAKKIMGKKMERETIKGFRNVLERIGLEVDTLKDNLFPNYDTINPDSESLCDSIIKSGENIEELEERIYEYQIDDSNDLGTKAMSSFKNNILLAKKNNILLDKILLYSKLYYNKSFAKFLKDEDKIDENNQRYKKIQEEKKRLAELEEQRKKEEEEEEQRLKMEGRNATEEEEENL